MYQTAVFPKISVRDIYKDLTPRIKKIPRPPHPNIKATDAEILDIRIRAERRHERIADIARAYPQYTYRYIYSIVNYRVRASIIVMPTAA